MYITLITLAEKEKEAQEMREKIIEQKKQLEVGKLKQEREIEENEAKLREEERRLAIQAEEELIENEEKLVDSIVDRIVFMCVFVYES